MKNKIIKEIKKDFTDGQVKNFMNEYNISELESCLYLYLFNNISVHTDDQRKDSGRKMYRSYLWTNLGIRLTNHKLDCKGLNDDR